VLTKVQKLNPVNAFIPYFSRNHFNIILLSASVYQAFLHCNDPHLHDTLSCYTAQTRRIPKVVVSRLYTYMWFRQFEHCKWIQCLHPQTYSNWDSKKYKV